MRPKALVGHLDKGTLVLVIACAVIFPAAARLTPGYVYVSLAAVAVVLFALLQWGLRWRRYRSIVDGVRQTHGNLLPDISKIKDSDPDKVVHKFLKELVSELERKNFQLVEKNIQLLQGMNKKEKFDNVFKKIISKFI